MDSSDRGTTHAEAARAAARRAAAADQRGQDAVRRADELTEWLDDAHIPADELFARTQRAARAAANARVQAIDTDERPGAEIVIGLFSDPEGHVVGITAPSPGS